jgi:mRNA interferase HicA
VKKRDLIKQLRALAAQRGHDLEFVREGRNHEVWTIGGTRIVIPRHREINERTARSILTRAKEVSDDR